ncbi:MAG: hypothetical protein ACRC37_07700, partial [Lentisphaeria bacterium]
IVTTAKSMAMKANSVQKVDVYLTAKPVNDVVITVTAVNAVSADNNSVQDNVVLTFTEANVVQSYYVHSNSNGFEVSYTLAEGTDSRFTKPENMNVTVYSGVENTDLTIEPTTLDFGKIAVGKSVTEYVMIKYSGDEVLPVSFTVFGGSEATIDTENISFNENVEELAVAWRLSKGAVIALPVTFTALTNGEKSYEIVVQTNNSVYSASASVKANAVNTGALVALNPTSIIIDSTTSEYKFSIEVTALSNVEGVNIEVVMPENTSITELPSGFTYENNILTKTIAEAMNVGDKQSFVFNASTLGLTAESVNLITVKEGTNAQIIVSDIIQLANLDVNGNGVCDSRDILLIRRYLPNLSGGLEQTGNRIFPDGEPLVGIDFVTAEELTVNLENLLKALDVNGNGESNSRDLLLIRRYLPNLAGGLEQTGNKIFPDGKPLEDVDFVTAEELTKNIDTLIK